MQKILPTLLLSLLAACGNEKPASMKNPASELLPWDSSKTFVKKTGSGLEYVVLNSGDASSKTASTSDIVTVHYDGLLASNKKLFDSSRQRNAPATFPANALIPGWIEALQLMRPGDRWLLYIPYQLAYGEQGRPPQIPASSDLVFDIELISVNDNAP